MLLIAAYAAACSACFLVLPSPSASVFPPQLTAARNHGHQNTILIAAAHERILYELLCHGAAVVRSGLALELEHLSFLLAYARLS